LIRKSLQPQNPRKQGARRHLRVDLKPNDLLTDRNDVINEHAFEMAPSAFLVAQIMLRDPDQSLTDQPIARVGPVLRKSAKSLC
jgi:hypothetical protein